MTRARLHEGQIDVPDALVRELVDSQFPQWANFPLTPLASDGTVNRVDLLGEELVVRIPIIEWGARDVERDVELLPMLAAALPVSVPTLVGRGAPAEGMPWAWGVYERLPGRHAVLADAADEDAMLPILVATIQALRELPHHGETSPSGFDAAADHAVTGSKVDAVGSGALTATWEAAIEASQSTYTGTFIHGDLMLGNLLVAEAPAKPGLTGVLDWAAAGIGDPAFDLLPAWSCLTARTRSDFLGALNATDLEIARARGYAARKVAWGLPYYRETLPGIAAAFAFMLVQLEA